jgi:hypothetical protein
MSESLPEIVGALSDEDEQMAVLLEVIRLEEKWEEIQKAPEYTTHTGANARLAHQLVGVKPSIG